MVAATMRQRHLRPRESESTLLGPSPNDDDYYDGGYHHVHHWNATHHRHHSKQYSASYSPQNHTITTSVSIRVTPLHDYFVSWGILWGSFLVVTLIATWQVVREYRDLDARRPRASSLSSTTTTTHKSTSGYSIIEVKHPTASDGESISTADVTRSMIRRLLLLALVTRAIAIPVEVFVDPMWWQFVGDTLPEMVFASAWTLLVTFFVQLVGVATGTGTNTSPGLVITLTAYAVYLSLILLQLHNKVASVLLYALLCCIYATLLGVVLYFCPILLTLLYRSGMETDGSATSSQPHRALTTRLSLVTAVCIFVFAAHTVRYARLVVAPPDKVYWWYQYGGLELVPTFIILILMQPNPSKAEERNLNAANSPALERRSMDGIRRVDSDIRRMDDPALSASLTSVSSGTRRDSALLAGATTEPPSYGSMSTPADAV